MAKRSEADGDETARLRAELVRAPQALAEVSSLPDRPGAPCGKALQLFFGRFHGCG